MKLQQLRYLIQVAESGSFTKAAAKLNLAQPALSRQIRLLEEDLGVTLFRRDGRGAEPTAAGRELVNRATVLFEDLYAMRQAVTSYRDTYDGEITIGMLPLLGARVVPQLLLKAREAYPNIKLNFMIGMSPAIQEWTIGGRVDFGIISTAVDTSSYLVVRDIAQDRLHMVEAVGKDNAPPRDVTLAEVLAHPLVIPTLSNGIRAVIDSYARSAGLPIEPVLEVDSIEIIKRLVPTGIGATILPHFSVRDEVGAGTLRSDRIIDPVMDYRVAIIFRSELPLSPAAAAIAGIIEEVAVAELGPPSEMI